MLDVSTGARSAVLMGPAKEAFRKVYASATMVAGVTESGNIHLFDFVHLRNVAVIQSSEEDKSAPFVALLQSHQVLCFSKPNTRYIFRASSSPLVSSLPSINQSIIETRPHSPSRTVHDISLGSDPRPIARLESKKPLVSIAAHPSLPVIVRCPLLFPLPSSLQTFSNQQKKKKKAALSTDGVMRIWGCSSQACIIQSDGMALFR